MVDYKNAGLAFLFIALISSIGFNIYDTGEELVCRTNSPVGWVILKQYDGFVKAECPYATKEHVIAYCKDEFRSTGSYERYGCKSLLLEEIEEVKKYEPSNTERETYICSPGVPCVRQ